MSAVLLITGGSAGIGAATARAAATHGYSRVILTYRSDAEGAAAVVGDLKRQGVDAFAVKADVANHEDTDRLFNLLRTKAPAPLHLVNNAGVVTPSGSVADLTPDRVAQMFGINVFGLIEMSRQAVQYMRETGLGGHIVNISSIASRLGSANMYIDYAASKGAVDTFTLGLADELAPEGIRVNAIRPGLIETEIHAKGGVPDRLEKIGKTPPLGRPGTADEIADAVMYLLSNRASYVTRSILDVGGGR
ncbi:SDR family oxidoreductase [Pseudoprimorskyibacter insulae]|uniref:Glucose 1-dehydrogenase 1 n=1 Tax=Pseudoprimorskyibacter insulae TaxID=1695997 RepID=A0A2R8AXC1_9RHOB|nr:SDR family oxidoreductase [Pseudoprimorskyibacter insulae]SPF80597.1 Glucose 1-dehydrogenase 1 [Pseudoprimorskyibacter insulae]